MTTTPNVAIFRFSDTSPAGRPFLSISVARHLDAIQKFSAGVRLTVTECVMSCRVHPDCTISDPSAMSRLDGNRVILGEIVSQFFKDGVEGVDYILTYLVTFSDGSSEPFDAVLSVRKFMGLQ